MPGCTFKIPEMDDADGPWPIFARLLETEDLALQRELLGFDDVTLAFAMRYDGGEDAGGGWLKAGKLRLGFCALPQAQGEMRDLFDWLLSEHLGFPPSFLIVLNGDWWESATDLEREALVNHEAQHMGQKLNRYGEPMFNPSTGMPTLGILPHDVEEFDVIVRRYGAWKSDLRGMRQAFADHEEHGPPPEPPAVAPDGWRVVVQPQRPADPDPDAEAVFDVD